MFARARPCGSLQRRSESFDKAQDRSDGSGTRTAQTALAEKSIRYGDEAASEGGGDTQETNQVLNGQETSRAMKSPLWLLKSVTLRVTIRDGRVDSASGVTALV